MISEFTIQWLGHDELEWKGLGAGSRSRKGPGNEAWELKGGARLSDRGWHRQPTSESGVSISGRSTPLRRPSSSPTPTSFSSPSRARIRFKGIKPALKNAKPGARASKDLEVGHGDFPMVLVQIPMCNEREVHQQLIATVCNLNWPRSNMLVQKLGDSDDPTTQAMIKEAVEKWHQNGARILYRH